jgi:hypothetical protein
MSTSSKFVYRLPAIELRSLICKLGLHGYRPRIVHCSTRVKPNTIAPGTYGTPKVGAYVQSLPYLTHILESQNTERKDL